MTADVNRDYDAEVVDRVRELEQVATDMRKRDYIVTDTERTTLRSADSLTETITVNWKRRPIDYRRSTT